MSLNSLSLKDYNFDSFFEAIYQWHPIINEAKYANNYDYNKAVYLMSEFDMLENGFLMIKEDLSYASPIATVFYEYYDNKDTLKQKLKVKKIIKIFNALFQKTLLEDEIAFGQTQKPNLMGLC